MKTILLKVPGSEKLFPVYRKARGDTTLFVSADAVEKYISIDGDYPVEIFDMAEDVFQYPLNKPEDPSIMAYNTEDRKRVVLLPFPLLISMADRCFGREADRLDTLCGVISAFIDEEIAEENAKNFATSYPTPLPEEVKF